MDGAMQPGGGGALWTTVQNRDEKGRGIPITERMEQEAVGTIMNQLFQQLPVLGVSPWKDKEGPPLLMAEEIYAAVGRVRANAKKSPARWNTEQCVDHRTLG